jgi:adenosylhomocysteine nucleosidase
MKGNIAIIAAVSGELAPLVKHRTARSWNRVSSISGVEMWEYLHADGCWLAVCAGMGGRRATVALAEAEKRKNIAAICSVGWAGALKSVFEAEKIYTPSLIVDTATGEQFRPAKLSVDWPILVSTSSVADADEKQKLATMYGAGLVDMEAATLAKIALSKAIPFYCMKAISDEANAELPNINPFINDSGQLKMLPFLLNLSTRPSSWAPLAKLGKHSAAAAKNLAESLYDWLDERTYIRQELGDYSKFESK